MSRPAHSPEFYHFRHPFTSASVRILLPAVTEIPTQAVLNDILKRNNGLKMESLVLSLRAADQDFICDLIAVSGSSGNITFNQSN